MSFGSFPSWQQYPYLVPPIPGFFPQEIPIFSPYGIPAPPFFPPVCPSIYMSALAAPTIQDARNSKCDESPAVSATILAPAPIYNFAMNTNMYTSFPGMLSNQILYSSALAAPVVKSGILNPIYVSLSSLPSGVSVRDKSNAPKAVVSEGYSTVGLMIWPQGPKKELIITGIKEGTSASTSGLEEGDIISSVDDEPVDNMKAEDVALQMAGPTGSKTKITTKGGREATLIRDVSADEANKTTVDVTPAPAQEKIYLTPAECQKYGLPLGSVWRSRAVDSHQGEASLPKAAEPAPSTWSAPHILLYI
jgi:hypothetical protein